MKKKLQIFFVIVFCSAIIFPVKVEAKQFDFCINSGNIIIKSMEKESTTTADTASCAGILGDVNDEDSVAWLVQKLLNYIKVLGPTIAIALGSLDFAKAVVTSDDESVKKAQSRFAKRMIAAVLLFFVPTLTGLLLGFFGITSDNATCGLS